MSPRFQAAACASRTCRIATSAITLCASSFLDDCANEDAVNKRKAKTAANDFITLPSEVSIVSGDLPGKHDVFHARACSDVMDDQVTLCRLVPDVNNHAHVIYAATEVPGHDVAGQKRVGIAGGRNFLAFASEKSLQVRDAAMVDV